MRILYRESVLTALVSLLIVDDNIATAFTPNVRRQPLSHSNNVHINIDCSRCEQDVRTSTRLFATPPSSSDKLTTTTTTNSRNDKKTTELRAATGISLSPSTPSIASPTTDDSNNSGLGVLFLNLGGPTTGDDVEGTSRG
jgi:hypothetical protein